MWEIYEHRRVSKKLHRLSKEILKHYEKWKDIVKVSGPHGLRLIKGFQDEALRGEWKGHRSSRLGVQHRLIYKIEAQKVLILVIDITPHNYRRS